MGNFQKAWAFTAGWEGGFDGNPKAKVQPLTDNVAVYGITPKFLKDYIGWTDKNATDTAKLKAITYEDAAKIWENSRWTWFKCNQIQSDALATLVFDMAVRRANEAAHTLAQAVGMTIKEGTQGVKFRTVGGNPTKPDDGMVIPNQTCIDKLNALCLNDKNEMDNDAILAIYQKIIQGYIRKAKPTETGVIRRLGCLLFVKTLDENRLHRDNFPSLPKAERDNIEQKVIAIRDGKTKSKLTADKPTNTEGSQWTTIMLTLVGGYVGGKIFKWW